MFRIVGILLMKKKTYITDRAGIALTKHDRNYIRGETHEPNRRIKIKWHQVLWNSEHFLSQCSIRPVYWNCPIVTYTKTVQYISSTETRK